MPIPVDEKTETPKTQDDLVAALGDEEVDEDQPAPPKTPEADVAQKPDVEPPAKKPEDERFEKLSSALQENQQDIKTLLKKLEQNGGLSPKETQRLEQAQTRAKNIEDDLGDILSDEFAGDPAIKRVAKSLENRLSAAEKRAQDAEDRATKLEATQAWNHWRTHYGDKELGPDHKFWTTAIEYAERVIPKASPADKLALVQERFHESANRAKKKREGPPSTPPRPPADVPASPPRDTPAPAKRGGAPRAPDPSLQASDDIDWIAKNLGD